MGAPNKTFTNCPKCQAEVVHTGFGGITYEGCPNCHGIFLDLEDTGNEHVAGITAISSRLRLDRKELDQMEIACPKCKIKMKKNRSATKKA